MHKTEHIKTFVSKHLSPGHEIVAMAGDASLRSYSRIKHHNNSYILMDSSLDPESMRGFLKVGNILSGIYSVPQIVAVDSDKHFAILEDLGDASYTKILQVNQDRERELYRHAVELLADLHRLSVDHQAHDLVLYGDNLLLSEVLLLVDWYYPFLHGKEISDKLRKEFIDLWVDIFSQIHFKDSCLVLRDYHADNLMWLHNRNGIQKVGLLDFQDAVIGSYAYDLVSLLEDARRDVDSAVVEEMLSLYIKTGSVDQDKFINDYNILGAQRNSKILGIFVRKFIRDKDVRYLAFLPRVFAYLYNDLNHPILKPMKEWFIKSELLNEDYLIKTLGKV